MTEDAGARPLIWSLARLGFVVTLVGLVSSFVAPFLPLFVSQELHASPGQTSLFLFLTPLAAIGVATVVGRLSDRPGLRHRLLIAAAGAGFVGFLGFAFLRNYGGVLAVALTFIAVAGSLMPQVFAFSRTLLDRDYPSRAATGVTSLRSLMSLAWVAGPPLAAYLIGAIDFRGLFVVAAVMHLAVLPALLRIRSPSPGGTAADPVGPDQPAAPTRGHLLRTSGAFVLLQCAGTLGVMSLPLLVSVDLPGSVGDAGFILGLCAALEIPLMLAFGALAARFPLRRLVLLGAGIGIAYFGAMSLTGAVWHVALAQVLNAGFVAAVTGLGMSYFQELMPSRPGRATTTFTNTYRLSAMLAGSVFGVVQVVGYRFAYILGAGLCVAGLAILALSRSGADARPTPLPDPATRR